MDHLMKGTLIEIREHASSHKGATKQWSVSLLGEYYWWAQGSVRQPRPAVTLKEVTRYEVPDTARREHSKQWDQRGKRISQVRGGQEGAVEVFRFGDCDTSLPSRRCQEPTSWELSS